MTRSLTWMGGALLAGVVIAFVLPGEWLFVQPRTAEEIAASSTRYACPMLCTIRTSPGPCPVCGMEMQEIKEAEGGLPLSEHERRMIGLRTAEAGFRTLWRTIRTVGRIEYDERRVRQVAAWIDGRIDRLVADYTGFVATKGAPLFEVYSPKLYESQQSYLSSLAALEEARDPRAREQQSRNVASTRKRLKLLGLTSEQIEDIARSGKLRTHVEVKAPIGGTVVEKRVIEGQYVKEGETLAVVADLTHLWVKVDVFEEDYAWIHEKQRVRVTTRALPTEVFEGTIAFIDPVLREDTRSVEARVEVANREGKLRPGMFAEVSVKVPLDYVARPYFGAETDPAALPKVLAVPEASVLITGTRAIVYVLEAAARYVEHDDGTREEIEPAKFVGRELELGPRADGYWPVLSGLKPGERVATRGAFLIDSQMQLSGEASLMHVPPAPESRSSTSRPTRK